MSHAPSLLFTSQQSTTPLSTLSTCTPVRPTTRPSSRPPLTSSSHADYTCADPSNSAFGPLLETTSPAGNEPNNPIEDNSMEIKPLFFHKPSMTSTCDTSETMASPLYLEGREASADRSQFYHSFRENSVSSSCHFRESAGKPAAMFPHKRKSSQDTFFDREGISSGHQTVQGKGETFVRFSCPEETVSVALEQQRDHQLAEAKSEILKQECKVDTVDTCIREFQFNDKLIPNV